MIVVVVSVEVVEEDTIGDDAVVAVFGVVVGVRMNVVDVDICVCVCVFVVGGGGKTGNIAAISTMCVPYFISIDEFQTATRSLGSSDHPSNRRPPRPT